MQTANRLPAHDSDRGHRERSRDSTRHREKQYNQTIDNKNSFFNLNIYTAEYKNDLNETFLIYNKDR